MRSLHLKVEVRVGQPVDVLWLQVHPFDHVNATLVAPGRAQEAHVDELADARVWRAFGHDDEPLQQADLLLLLLLLSLLLSLLLMMLLWLLSQCRKKRRKRTGGGGFGAEQKKKYRKVFMIKGRDTMYPWTGLPRVCGAE